MKKITYIAKTSSEYRGSECDNKTAEAHAEILGWKMVEYLGAEYPGAEVTFSTEYDSNKIANVDGFENEEEVIDDIKWFEEAIWLPTLQEAINETSNTNYTLALDVHKELQQWGFSTKAAGWLENVYRELLEAELEDQFGGVWKIAGEMDESDIPEEADGDSLNEVFARVAEDMMIELRN